MSFDSLAGVPLHYDRSSPAEYGTRGRPVTLRCGPQFSRKLEVAFADLWSIAGVAQVVTSGGAWVNKPGLHGQGRAFDLDGIFWAEREFVTLRDGFEGRNRRLYFGVEAILRRHFGTVLDFHFNQAHRDHFHVDDGASVGFRPSAKSLILFVQAALNEFYRVDLRVDGVYGPLTRAALQDVAGNVTAPAEWLGWLGQLARKGAAHV